MKRHEINFPFVKHVDLGTIADRIEPIDSDKVGEAIVNNLRRIFGMTKVRDITKECEIS